jgi:hypothetical protein
MMGRLDNMKQQIFPLEIYRYKYSSGCSCYVIFFPATVSNSVDDLWGTISCFYCNKKETTILKMIVDKKS